MRLRKGHWIWGKEKVGSICVVEQKIALKSKGLNAKKDCAKMSSNTDSKTPNFVVGLENCWRSCRWVQVQSKVQELLTVVRKVLKTGDNTLKEVGMRYLDVL